jgi:hypothetical protein
MLAAVVVGPWLGLLLLSTLMDWIVPSRVRM